MFEVMIFVISLMVVVPALLFVLLHVGDDEPDWRDWEDPD